MVKRCRTGEEDPAGDGYPLLPEYMSDPPPDLLLKGRRVHRVAEIDLDLLPEVPACPGDIDLDGAIGIDRHETAPAFTPLSHIAPLRVAGVDDVRIAGTEDRGLMDVAERPVVVAASPEILDTARGVRFMARRPPDATVEETYREGPFVFPSGELLRKVIVDMGCCKTHPHDRRKGSAVWIAVDDDLGLA